MNQHKTFESVYDDFQKLKDAIKITKRALKRNHNRIVKNTTFAVNQNDDLPILERHVEDWFYITAWAFFERRVIEFFHHKMDLLQSAQPESFGIKLQEKACDEVERWNKYMLLDLLKTFIDSDAIGMMKQLAKYRDWLAHRNPEKTEPPPSSPLDIYEKMRFIVDELNKHTLNH